MPALDLIIPHHGGSDILWRCLLHAWQFSPPDTRITIVDDCSPDTAHLLGDWLNRTGRATYVRNAENRGYTFTCMEGYRLTANDPAPYFVFLNNDCCVMPGTLDLLLKVAKKGHSIVCAPSRGVVGESSFDPTEYMKAVDAEPTTKMGFGFVCTVIERALTEQIGCLDEDYRQLFSDTDFILRAFGEGHAPVLVNEALIYHQGTVSGKRLGVTASAIQYVKDRTIFYEKWGKDHPELFDVSKGGVNMDITTEQMADLMEAQWSGKCP